MRSNKKIIACAATFFVLSAFILPPLRASGQNEKASVRVNGTGIVSIKPDTAVITLAVVTNHPTASIAATQNAKLMSLVTEAVTAAGVKKDDIATRNYNVYREYIYNSSTQQNEAKDYRVSNYLTVTVRDIEKTGSVIDAALSGGANELSDVRFFASDTLAAYEQARFLAVKQAEQAAQTLARAAGRNLGKALSIEEFSNNSAYRNAVAADSKLLSIAAATPVNPGDTEISASVSLVFALN